MDRMSEKREKKRDYFAVFAFVLVAMYVVARLNLNYTAKKTHNFVLVLSCRPKPFPWQQRTVNLKLVIKTFCFFCGTYRV